MNRYYIAMDNGTEVIQFGEPLLRRHAENLCAVLNKIHNANGVYYSLIRA